MTKLIDALSARTHFGKLIKEAEEKNMRFLISKRGKPMVVILGVEDYLKNIVKESSLLTKIQINAQKAGLDQIGDKEIEVEIAAYRKTKK